MSLNIYIFIYLIKYRMDIKILHEFQIKFENFKYLSPKYLIVFRKVNNSFIQFFPLNVILLNLMILTHGALISYPITKLLFFFAFVLH